MWAFLGVERLSQGDLLLLCGVISLGATFLGWISDLILARLAFGMAGNAFLAAMGAMVGVGAFNTLIEPARLTQAMTLVVLAMLSATLVLMAFATVKRLVLRAG